MGKPRINFDDYAVSYETLLRESTRFFTKSENYFAKYKVDILRRVAPPNTRRLLEFGCGIGRNIPFLRIAFPEAKISGSDISAVSLEMAQHENPGIDFFLEDSATVFSDQYEVIFVAGVFHHIPASERSAVMKLLYKRLAPSGAIVVFEHNPLNPVTRRIVENCPFDRDVALIGRSELEMLAENAGLKVRQSAYCLFLPPSLRAFSVLESKLGWLPLGGQFWVKATRPT